MAGNALDGKRLLFEDGRAFRRAQLLACRQPADLYEKKWEFWFLPFRKDSSVFLVDEVVHPDLIPYTWESETGEVSSRDYFLVVIRV